MLTLASTRRSINPAERCQRWMTGRTRCERRQPPHLVQLGEPERRSVGFVLQPAECHAGRCQANTYGLLQMLWPQFSPRE